MNGSAQLRLALLGAAVFATACGEAPPPRGSTADSAGSGSASAPSSAPRPAASPATSVAAAASTPPTTPPAGTSASAPATPAAAPIDLARAPELLDANGKPLPQTDARPTVESPAFKERLALVFRAIVADDPAIAEPAFFPQVAYEQVKDIKDPAADWKARLIKAFARNIHAYHKELGDNPAGCKLLGIEVDEARVKVMERGKEGNKLPYHRVTRSRIRWSDATGKERTFELTSLISWRGEWFVVHLNGFK